MTLNLNPATVAPLASFTASGRARRKTASRFYFAEQGATGLGTLALSFTTGGSGHFNRTLTAPGGPDRSVEVILRQRRSDGVWAQVDMKLLTINPGGGGTTPPSPPPDEVPPTFGTPSVTAITQTGATISWTTNEASTSQIEYGPTTSYGSSTTLDSTLVSSHSQSISGLTAGTVYHYRIRSADAAGNMGTRTGSFTTASAAPSPPAAPTGLTATPGNTTVSLTWNAISGATYKVYRDNVLIASPTSTSLVDTGRTNGVTYSYKVSAVTGGGEGAQSAAVTATPNAPPADTTPPTIGTPVHTALTQTSVTVAWTTNEPATGQIEYGTSVSYGSTTTLDGTLTNSKSQTISSLTAGTVYFYRINARDAATNLGTRTGSFTTTSAPPAPPVAPTGLTATPGNTTVALNWNAISGCTYKVYKGGVFLAASSGTSYVATGLTNGVQVSFTVSAVNGGGEGPQSGAVTATPTSPPGDTTPPVISNIAATGITQTGATVSWNVNEPATGQVQYGLTTAYGSLTTLETGYLLSHIQDITGLSPNTLYHYRLKSADAASNMGTRTGSFTTAATPNPPPPSGGVPVPDSIDSTGATNVMAALRDFIIANAGSRVILKAGGTYRCDSEMVFTSVTGIGIVSDPANRATIWGNGYHPVIRPRGCTNFYAADIIISGSAPNPGVTNFTNEHGHGVHLDGGTNYTFERVLIKNVEGDGFYCAQYGTTPGSGLTVNDSRIEGISRMGFGVVAWQTIRANRMAFHNTGWRPIDLEPDPNVSYQQKANDCIFDRGEVTGWVGNFASGGLQYMTLCYLGTPISQGGFQPLVQNNKVLRYHVASTVRAGIGTRIEPAGTNRVTDFEYGWNTADGTHNPCDGVGFVACINATNVNVHDCAMNMGSSGWAVGNNGGSTGLSASGNTGANLVGQVKP